MKYSIIPYQVNSAIVIVEESEGKSRLLLQRNIHTDKITACGTFEHESTTYFYTASFDKFIRFWTLPAGSETLTSVNSCVLQKKITHSFHANGQQFITDKYGDIYSFTVDRILRTESDLFPQYENSNNLAIQQAFAGVSHADRMYCLLGDSYSKIKLFDLKEMHDLVSFWVPFESHLIEILEFPQLLALVFQMKDSETLEKRYAVHLFDKDQLLNPDYSGKPVEGLTFQDDLNKVRVAKTSANDGFVVYAVNKKGKLYVQEFNLAAGKVVRSQEKQLSFEVQNNEKLYLNIVALAATTVAVAGIKEAVSSEQVISEATLETSAAVEPRLQNLVEKHDIILF